jgi:hypothetical protein
MHHQISGNESSGVVAWDGCVYCSDCYISRNQRSGILVVATKPSRAPTVALVHCEFADNASGALSYLSCGERPSSTRGNTTTTTTDEGEGEGVEGDGDEEGDGVPVFMLHCAESSHGADWTGTGTVSEKKYLQTDSGIARSGLRTMPPPTSC